MTKYKVIRKYPTEQFGNMDFEARGLDSRDDISKELEHFDKIAEEYREKYKKEEEIVISPFPDRKGEKPKGMPKSTPF